MDDWDGTLAARAAAPCRTAPARHGTGRNLAAASWIKAILIYFIFAATIKSLLLLFMGVILYPQLRTDSCVAVILLTVTMYGRF